MRTKATLHRNLIFLLMIAMTVTGCRTHHHLQRSGSPDKPGGEPAVADNKTKAEDEAMRLDSLLHSDCHQYSANFSCTIDGVRVNGQIRLVTDSIIWVSVSKIVELGRAVFTPSGVKAYINLANKYFDGDYTTVNESWGVDIDYGTLQALLLGDRPPHCSPQKAPQRQGETVTLLYTQNGNRPGRERQVTITKEMASNRPTNTEVQCQSLNQRIRCSYTTRSDIGGQLLPTVIEVVLNSSKTNISTQIQLEKLQLNRQLSFPFKIPENYKKM